MPDPVYLRATPIGRVDMVTPSDGDDRPLRMAPAFQLYHADNNLHQVYVEPLVGKTAPGAVIGVLDFVGRRVQDYRLGRGVFGQEPSQRWRLADPALGLLAHPEHHLAFIQDVTACIVAAFPYRDCAAFVLLQLSGRGLSVHTYVDRGTKSPVAVSPTDCLADAPTYRVYHERIREIVDMFWARYAQSQFRPIEVLIRAVEREGINIRIGA